MQLNYLQNVCMSCTKVPIAVGLTSIMILFNTKKYCVLNMAAMERKQAVKMHKIRYMLFRLTWHQMVCCFTQAICFLKNIRMVHSLHFTDHGIVLLNPRKDISLHSFLLKMENQVVNGKYSQIILPARKMCSPVLQG